MDAIKGVVLVNRMTGEGFEWLFRQKLQTRFDAENCIEHLREAGFVEAQLWASKNIVLFREILAGKKFKVQE